MSLFSIKIAVKAMSICPFWLLYFLSDVAFYLLFYVFKYRRKVVTTNLKKSFPAKPEKEIKTIEKEYYRHLGDLLLESVKGLSLPKSTFEKRFKFLNPEIFPQDESAILLGSHYGNWEWGVLSFPLSVKHTVLGIYKPLSNRSIDGYLNQLRKQWGLHLAPMSKAGRSIFEYKNKPTLFVLINDQTPSDVHNAHWLNFLNQDTPFLHGADKLSRKTNLPVYYFEIEKIKRGYYEVSFSILKSKEEELNEKEITIRYANALSKTIHKNPAYWLWSHKRWKRKRPT